MANTKNSVKPSLPPSPCAIESRPAHASAAGFHWILEDITEGLILMEGDSQGVSSSQIQSEITTRSFSTTGIHALKLSLDTNNVLDEMNDESSGVNNNIIEVDIEVTALGVRVVPLNDDGSVPSLEVDRQQAAIKNFDVRNETSIDIPITLPTSRKALFFL